MYYNKINPGKAGKNIIYVDQGDKPSRFLVDLNRLPGEQDKDEKEGKASRFIAVFYKGLRCAGKKFYFGFLQGTAAQLAERFQKTAAGRDGLFTKLFWLHSMEHISHHNAEGPLGWQFQKSNQYFSNVKSSFKNWYKSHQKKFNRLAFFPLIKLFFLVLWKIILLFYKACHKIGWSVVFLIRFIFLSGLFVIKLFFNLLLKIAPGLRFFVHTDKIRKKKCSAVQKNSFIHNIRLLSAVKCYAQKLWQGKKKFAEIHNIISQPVELAKTVEPPEDNLINSLSAPKRFSLKPALVFALILLILILPFKAFTYYKDLHDLRGKVLGVSEAAVDELKIASQAAAQLDFKQASQSFSYASNNFIKAKDEISEVRGLFSVLAAIVPSKDIKLAANADLILEAGRLSAEIGNHLSMAFSSLSRDGSFNTKEVLNSFYTHSQAASQYARELKIKIDKINPEYLPSDYKEKFLAIKDKVDIIAGSLDKFTDLLEKAGIFLGLEHDKRYLLVFQNNTEMRASGGFIGSFALVDFRNGEIKKIEVPRGGSYDTEAGLYERIIAPEPLHLVNPLWHFWDANWWPDWPSSARKLMWFYERSDGPTVDGIISFTPTVMERILEVIGPIDMSDGVGAGVSPATLQEQGVTESSVAGQGPATDGAGVSPAISQVRDIVQTNDYNLVLTAENFWEIVQNFSEQKLSFAPSSVKVIESEDTADGKHKPKKIIGDLLNKIIDELPGRLDKDTLIGLIKVMEENLREKHILFYFTDDDLQKKTEELGWDGKVKQTAWDYLMVVNTNIAGGKSDRKIKEEISHTAEVAEDGSIINTVEIKRTHTGIKNEPFCGVRNVDWMRIYTPQGSRLIEAHGFIKPDEEYFEDPEDHWQKDPEVARSEDQSVIDIKSGTKIYNENNKTIFANWSMVDPGHTTVIYLKYKLPFKLEEVIKPGFISQAKNFMNPAKKQLIPYALLAQKQPGSMGSEFNGSLKLPDNLKVVWKYPIDADVKFNGWEINDSLTVDKYWAVLLEAK